MLILSTVIYFVFEEVLPLIEDNLCERGIHSVCPLNRKNRSGYIDVSEASKLFMIQAFLLSCQSQLPNLYISFRWQFVFVTIQMLFLGLRTSDRPLYVHCFYSRWYLFRSITVLPYSITINQSKIRKLAKTIKSKKITIVWQVSW